MLGLSRNTLEFSFPELHEDAHCRISFQRTLRLPDDNKVHSLPPSMGEFPLLHTDDFAKTTPEHWQKMGGVILPMYQSEALWINFETPNNYPFAVKVATGKINAVTGDAWKNALSSEPQDYVVLPKQPWLDGFHTTDGAVRQFVAMPLGEGFTAEEQLTGKAEFGDLQIMVYPMKLDRYLQKLEAEKQRQASYSDEGIKYSLSPTMGMAAGGFIKQEIYDDKYGIDAWETDMYNRCFVHLTNSEQWNSITGKQPPTKPITAKAYNDAGLPWFDYYSDASALPAGNVLSKLQGIASQWRGKKQEEMPDNSSIKEKKIIQISQKKNINDGDW